MTGRFGAAVSEHPNAAYATGEVVGQVLDQVGAEPEFAIAFVTSGRTADLSDVCEAVGAALRPGKLLAVTSSGVVGNDREVEAVPAISLWAGRVEGPTCLRVIAERTGDGAWRFPGAPASSTTGTLILLADPFSFPVEAFLEDLAVESPDLVVVGGLAAGSSMPGGNRLVLDGEAHASGAVGVLCPPGSIDSVVSQGCAPVGDPFTVTRVEGERLLDLGGRPAVDRLRELVAGADEAQHEVMQRGLHLGVVVDEHQLDFRRGDFLIRGVMGIDAHTGSITVGARLSVGQTVQFQVRDARTAHEDLRARFDERAAASALLFTCNGRGPRLFDGPHHDASLIHEALGRAPLAGMACAGEIGPIGPRAHVHGFTASVALFR